MKRNVKSESKAAAYRQGDVMLLPIAEIPTGAKPAEHPTLALGEATGHSHVVIKGDVFVGADGKMFVRAAKGTTLRHQDRSGAIAEHRPFKVAPGCYEVRIEEEYTPEGLRRVED